MDFGTARAPAGPPPTYHSIITDGTEREVFFKGSSMWDYWDVCALLGAVLLLIVIVSVQRTMPRYLGAGSSERSRRRSSR